LAETLLARKFSDAIGAPFNEAFRHQYALSDRPLALDEFEYIRLGKFHIYHNPDLPVAAICTVDGTRIGVILGYATAPDGTLLQQETPLSSITSDATKFEAIEAQVLAFSGRFVAIVSCDQGTNTQSRVYLDPIGALGAMYDARSRIVASSLLLTLNRDIDPNPLFDIPKDVSGIPEVAGLVPKPVSQTGFQTPSFGHSFDRHVEQLLTNHALDLETFTAIRTPLTVADPELVTPEAAADTIVDRLNSNLSAVFQQNTGYLAISGGRDSRMLMAAAPGGFGARFPFYCYSDNWITGVDLRLAQTLAEARDEPFIGQFKPGNSKMSHFPREKRSRYFQRRCAVANGLRGTGDAWWKRGYFRKLQAGSFWLRGNALEVVTARLWTPTIDAPPRKAMRHALRRLGLATDNRRVWDQMLQRLIAWRDTLPDDAQKVFHDFWYQELFLSHSQGEFLGYSDLIYFPPASDGAIFTAARSVNPGLRRTNVLYDAIIRAGRPELSQIPLTQDITRKIKQTGCSLESILGA
jgi:hypothetical protein